MAVGNGMGIGIPMVNLGLGGGSEPSADPFRIRVNTNLPGQSNSNQFTLPWIGSYEIDWGDGVTETGLTNTTTHTYAALGLYNISVTPTGPCQIAFDNGGDKNKLLTVYRWGTGSWTTFSRAFYGCSNLSVTAPDLPDLSNVLILNNMFRNCTAMTGIGSNFPLWNTRNVTEFINMFRECEGFNEPIGNWDTRNVTSMSGMFFGAKAFNQPIGNWNTRDLTNTRNMFKNGTTNSPYAFDQSLADWNIRDLTYADDMFLGSGLSTPNYDALLVSWGNQIGNENGVSINFGNSRYTAGGAAAVARNTLINTYGWTIVDGGASVFAPLSKTELQTAVDLWVSNEAQAIIDYGDINTWNVVNITDMSRLFEQKYTFNSDISNWNVSNVANMRMMFRESPFNQPIGNWDVSNVTNMQGMFRDANSFNQVIGNWDVSNVTDMALMFYKAEAFNQPIGNWDVSNVANMYYMFGNATSFNRDLSSWSAGNVTNCTEFSYNTPSWTLPKPTFTNCTP